MDRLARKMLWSRIPDPTAYEKLSLFACQVHAPNLSGSEGAYSYVELGPVFSWL
jgi:hypothetical protein